MLFKIEAISHPEELPISVSRLLYLANLKSDLDTENEIFDSFLHECKSILDEEYDEMLIKIKTHDDLKQMGALILPDKLHMPHFNDIRNHKLNLENDKKEEASALNSTFNPL